MQRHLGIRLLLARCGFGCGDPFPSSQFAFLQMELWLRLISNTPLHLAVRHPTPTLLNKLVWQSKRQALGESMCSS